MLAGAIALWVLGLFTAVPYAGYYLLYHAPRSQYAILITFVLFWILGYWGVVGPLLAIVKVRTVFRAIEGAKAKDDLMKALRSDETRDVAIDFIATDNHIPRFLARRVYGVLIAKGQRSPPPPRSANTTMNDEATEMFAYYEARADGYDDFYQGKGQAVPELATEYPVDTAGVSSLLSKFGSGDVLDLACGTGFWLMAYGSRCRSVTLVDQSAAALARCQRRVDDLRLADKAQLVQGDLFDVALPERAYDGCLLGFLVSHLTEAQVAALFARLHRLLRPQAELAVVDSSWSEARRPYCQRDGFEARPLPDGRTFSIRKRYFARPELESLLARHGFHSESHYLGNVFIAVRARRNI